MFEPSPKSCARVCSSEPPPKKGSTQVLACCFTQRIFKKKKKFCSPALFNRGFIMSENEKRRNSPLRARSKLRCSVKATCCSPRSFLSFSEYYLSSTPLQLLAMTSRLPILLGRLVRTFFFCYVRMKVLKFLTTSSSTLMGAPERSINPTLRPLAHELYLHWF